MTGLGRLLLLRSSGRCLHSLTPCKGVTTGAWLCLAFHQGHPGCLLTAGGRVKKTSVSLANPIPTETSSSTAPQPR